MVQRNMKQLMEVEFTKLRNYPKWRTYRVVPVEALEEELRLLKVSGTRYKKIPVQRNNVIVGYKIKIRE